MGRNGRVSEQLSMFDEMLFLVYLILHVIV